MVLDFAAAHEDAGGGDLVSHGEKKAHFVRFCRLIDFVVCSDRAACPTRGRLFHGAPFDRARQLLLSCLGDGGLDDARVVDIGVEAAALGGEVVPCALEVVL